MVLEHEQMPRSASNDSRRGVSPRAFPGVNEKRAVRHRAYSPFDALRGICFALTDVMC